MQVPFINEANQAKLRARFEQDLVDDVRLLLFVQPPSGLYVPGREEPQMGRAAQQLMEELAALSPKLHLEVHDPRADPEIAGSYRVERTPALIVLPGADQPAAGTVEDSSAGGLVRFFGLPSGYEFTTLLEDIVDVSRGRTRLSDTTRQALQSFPEPVHIQVFVTPT